MFYCDSHIHLQDYKSQDVKNVISSALQNRVNLFINPSSNPSDWPIITELSMQYQQIIPAYGIHPWYINNATEGWEKILEDILQNNPLALVGECGIDRLKNPNTLLQKEILQKHINLAQKYSRPLIIHAVKADEQLREMFFDLPRRTIFHSYTGSVEWGKTIQKHGFFIGLNFSVLRKKNAAEIIKSLDFTQVLLETDGPYQNIVPQKGTLPQDLPLLAQKIAEILKITLDELCNRLYINQQQFLGV